MHIEQAFSMVAAQRALGNQARWPADRLRSHRADALRELRAWAYARSPYYQRFHRGLQHRPLADLPVLTKEMLLDHFDAIVTDRRLTLAAVTAHLEDLHGDDLLLGTYRVLRTSGSSALPGVTVRTPEEWAIVTASFVRANEWAGSSMPGMRRAIVTAQLPWHLSGRLSLSLNQRQGVRCFDATGAIAAVVDGLNDFQPDSIVSYPSMVKVLLAEQSAGRLHITPRVVVLSSEMASAALCQRIRTLWNAAAFDMYAATETGVIAAECRHHCKHLFDDLLIVENVDEHNRPVPPGVAGARLLITALHSRTQPLIRYELPDRVTLAPAGCACGSPFAIIEEIDGRYRDVLMLRSQAEELLPVSPLFFQDQFDHLPVAGWQVIHEADGRLRVILLRPPQHTGMAAIATNLARALEGLGCKAPPIAIEAAEVLVKMATGKVPLVWSRQLE